MPFIQIKLDMKILKAKELIENNTLANIGVTGNTTVVFTEIALTAVNLAREEGRQEMKKNAIEIVCPILANCEGFKAEDVVYLEQQMRKLL